MLMYLLMFAAIIKLRRDEVLAHANFKIPGKTLGLILVVGAGIIGCVLTFAVSFMLPPQINVGDVHQYHVLQTLGLILMAAPPLVMHVFNRYK